MVADGKLCIDQVFGRCDAVYSGCFYMYHLGDSVLHVDAGSACGRNAAVARRNAGPCARYPVCVHRRSV